MLLHNKDQIIIIRVSVIGINLCVHVWEHCYFFYTTDIHTIYYNDVAYITEQYAYTIDILFTLHALNSQAL